MDTINPSHSINCMIRPSKIFLMVNLFFYCLLLFWWQQSVDDIIPMICGTISIVVLLCYSVWRYIFLASPNSWIGFEAKDSPTWSLVSRKGKIFDATLRPDSYLFPGLLQLRFNVSGRYRPVTITVFKDSLMPDDWRRLRVLLTWALSKTSS